MRAPRGGDDVVPGLVAPSAWRPPARTSGRTSTAACTPGRPCCAAAGWPSLLETITLVERLPGRVLSLSRRRAAAHRPAPRRPAAARGGVRRAARAPRRWPCGCGERIAEAEQDTATRSAAGGWSPTPRPSRCSRSTARKGLEFPVVYLPVPVGADAGSTRAGARRLPRPRRRLPRARSTSGSTGRTSGATRSRHVARAARRGPAARLRRAHPRAAPGGRVVGGRRGTAATRRSRGCCSRATPTATSPAEGQRPPSDDDGAGALRGARRAGAGLRERRARRRCGAAGGAGRGAPRRRRRSPRRASTASSTAAGGARPTPTSPRPRTRRAWRASRRSRCSTTSRTRSARPTAPTARRGRLRGTPVPLGDMPGRRARSARSCTGARGDRLRGARPERSWRAHVGARRWRGGPSRSAIAARSSPGCAAAIETPLGPLVGDLRLCDVARADRLDELGFELPLAGGDTPAGPLTPARDRRAAAPRTCPPDDPLAGYAARLADPDLRGERARLPDRQSSTSCCASASASRSSTTRRTGSPRRASRSRAWHHRPAALGGRDGARALRAPGAALHGRAAPLPALAAAAATTPSGTSRGVLYLFVRGMTGRTRGGVRACSPGGRRRRWCVALSDLLDDGRA